MEDFTFFNPTRIIFGRRKEHLIGSELRAAGMNRVLFVFGQDSIRRSGLFDRIADSLDEHRIAHVPFGGVIPNPVLSHTRQGIRLAKAEGVDAVLAVGGGSVLDEAKAIAVGAVSETDVWEFFTGREITGALPVFTVLTLAATGSEMNGNSVVTNEETREKFNIGSPHCYPRVSILNPELTFSVSAAYTAYAAVDAIAHVLEGYFTSQGGGSLQDRLVESIVRTVMETTGIILDEPENYDARAEFEWAATLALNGLTTAGVGAYGFPNHMIEHSLSAIYGIPHGAGLSIVMPAWMKWFSPRCIPRFERLAREVFGLVDAAEGIRALEDWFRKIGSPVRLSEVAIPASDVDSIAENAARLSRKWGLIGIYPQEVIAEILRLAV